MKELVNQLSDARIIPLKDYEKVPTVKWNNDTKFELNNDIKTYAIDTGRSGLVVIDCDNHSEESDGVEKFMELYKEKEGDYPDTFCVETPNNGMHFYFKAPKNTIIKSSNSKIWGKGIDIKASGGYIVGPGSKVKDLNNEIKEYQVVDDTADIMEIPNWIEEFLIISQKQSDEKTLAIEDLTENYNKIVKELPNDTEELERRQALDWALSKMRTTEKGSRQSTLNDVSYFMGCVRVDPSEAEELVQAALLVGLTEKESIQTFRRAYSDGLKQEPQKLDNVIRQFNANNGISYKDDPTDPEFYTHFSLAANFKQRFDETIFYWTVDRSWYAYKEDKGTWESVDEIIFKTRIREFIEELIVEIRTNNKKFPASIYKMQERLYSRSTVDNVAMVARTYLCVDKKDLFDAEPYLINCKNGIFDIQSKSVIPHNKKYYMTKYIPVDVDLNFKDYYCDKVLESIDPDLIDYVQMIAGQSLVAEQPRTQVAYFFLGGGSNGKSSFLDLLLKTSGNYGRLQPPSVLVNDKNRENYALSDFENLRTAVIEELPDSKFLNSGALKGLVGTHKVNAREIYSSNREFINKTTIFVSCNKLPMVGETDEGTWRRMKVIKFPYTYVKSKEDLINPTDKLRDTKVVFNAQRRTDTAKAFLAWRLQGAIKWFNDPDIEDKIPVKVEETTNNWRESNDLIFAWFNETFNVKSEDHFVTMLDVYRSYNDWASARNNVKMSLRNFSESFKTHPLFNRYNLQHKKADFVKSTDIRSEYVSAEGEVTEMGKRPTLIRKLEFK